MGYGDDLPIFRSAFMHRNDEDSGKGIRPVVFDIVAPDYETSFLPDDVKLVLHVNPSNMQWSYSKVIERIQTKGGWVEQHFGDGTTEISVEQSSGGMMRLYSGLSNVTGGGYDTDGTRRQTIAYDKYLDILALFHNNGAIFDDVGTIAFQGIIKMSFDGEVFYGWFTSFDVSEAADSPYQFTLSYSMTISHEVRRLRTTAVYDSDFTNTVAEANAVDGKDQSGAWDGGLFTDGGWEWGKDGGYGDQTSQEYAQHIFTTNTKYGSND